uniref:trypsin n=1 Tax=Scophthalmus maximus TaxID=52904 RepID=A0A8D3BI22_SCOMX
SAAMTRLRLLLVSAWLSVTVSTGMDVQKRIVGGNECERHYHVHLRIVFADGKSSFCGGTLISDQWIVTAAHCHDWTMYADLSGGVDGGEEITAAPVKYEDVQKRPHDIMLLKLPQATTIKPVGLPDCDKHLFPSSSSSSLDPALTPKLHCADFNVVDCKSLIQTMLKDFPKQYKVKAYQHWICGQSPGVDVCYGDSGGGAVFRDEIYGVLSFLGDPNYVCRKESAFMDLCNQDYKDWFNKTIKT